MFYLSIKFLQNSHFLASSVKVNRGQNLVEKSTNQTRRRAAVMMSSSAGVSARLLLQDSTGQLTRCCSLVVRQEVSMCSVTWYFL